MTAHNEERALDALIAITIRAGINNEVTQAEIDEHMTRPQLTAEESEAYEAWRKTALAKAMGGIGGRDNVAVSVDEEAFAAMNRKNESEQHDEVTEEELERLRTKLLDEEDEQQ